jgi:flagellar capping protein FliD
MRAFSRLVTASVVLALVGMMVLAGLFVAAPGACASHETVSWLYAGTLSSAPGFDRRNPVVVTDGVTDLYVFYFTTQTSSGATNINVTKVSLGTGFMGTPTLVSDEQVNDVTNVVYGAYPMSATIDASGNLYVAWTHIFVPGVGYDLYVSKSADGGVTWLPAVLANAPAAAADDIMPSIVTNAEGTVYVAWTQTWSPFVNVTVSQSTDGGATFTGFTNASGQDNPGYATFPSLSVDAGGRLYLAYLGWNPMMMLDQHVNVTTSDDGLAWTAPTRITPESTLALYPSSGVDAHGRVHLFWFDFRGLLTTGMPTVWQSMSLDRGASWTSGSPISQGLASPSTSFPPATAYHQDEIMVGWGSSAGLSYLVSADGGLTWTPELSYNPGYTAANPKFGVDQNGTVYAATTYTGGTYDTVEALFWFGPPSAPVITSVSAGTSSLTVSWSAAPEKDVTGYQVYRSTNGVDFSPVASLGAGTTTYQDTSLADGTYWYEVEAVDSFGTPSHPSAARWGTIGPTLASLQQQINQLQADVTSANADLATIQTQLDSVKGQLSNLQGNTSALQDQVNALQDQLNNLQAQQATQTMAYANLAFEIIVVVLLVILLLNQMRKPKSPQIMMAQPAQVESRKPEDDL